MLNRAIARRHNKPADSWDAAIYTPPHVVSGSERVQIEDQLDRWVERLLVCRDSSVLEHKAQIISICTVKSTSLDVPDLSRPLRPIFVTPSTSVPPQCPSDFLPVFCLSASVFIDHGGPEVMRDQWGGFEYIQGSGDDDELWAKVSRAQAFRLGISG